VFRSFVRSPIWLVLLALLAGAFLRFHQLGSVPPGLHYDFAANAILANDIAFNNFREVFISAYTGKEVLFFYTAALLFLSVGSSIFTLQLTAAIYGILGIAACYFAARQVTWGWPGSRWLAAFAAAILAFTFMHLVWSRYGERATTEPFIQGLAIGFLFRGLRLCRQPEMAGRLSQNPFLNLALSGVFTGLAAYTYLAARLFPIPVALTLLISLVDIVLHHRTQLRLFLGGVAVFVVSAALVFAPLGLFFLRHPETFLVRASQLTPRAGETDLLWRGITGALGMIFIVGEPYDRFNIPGRPIFDPILGLFFIIGLIIILVQLFFLFRRSRSRSPLPYFLSTSFLLIYTLTFLAPTALSVHDIFPSNVRSMGLLPILTIFPALGLVEAIAWITKRFRLEATRLTPYALLLTILIGTVTTYYAYFNVWAVTPSLHYANDTDLVEASRWLNEQDTTNTSVYFSAIHYRHPTVAYLAHDFADIRWFTGGQSLAIPTGPALYIFPHSAPPPADWLAQWTPLYAPLGPDGTPDFSAYRFDAPPPLPGFLPASANFGNLIQLTGYRLAAPGVVDFRLQVLNPPDKPDYRLVADLVDGSGYHWAQAFNDTYFSEQWQVGETILMRLQFKTEVGTPPGNYQAFLTLFSAGSKTNVAALTPDGHSAAYAEVGPIPLTRSDPQPLATPLFSLGGLNVLQLDPPPAHSRPGEPLPFTLHWQAPAALTRNEMLVTKLNTLTLESIAPVHNTYPVTQWQAGEIVIDRHSPRLPRDLAPGIYNVTVNDFLIGTVTVDELKRELTPPSPTMALSANFGDLFELMGYDLTPDSLTLYWHTLKETDTDYTAFVHVLDSSGTILAQHDSQPRNGDYPTSLWVSGEYVSDTISLPTAGNSIEIGWYVPETGERLKTATGEAVVLRLPGN